MCAAAAHLCVAKYLLGPSSSKKKYILYHHLQGLSRQKSHVFVIHVYLFACGIGFLLHLNIRILLNFHFSALLYNELWSKLTHICKQGEPRYGMFGITHPVYKTAHDLALARTFWRNHASEALQA